MKTRFILFVLLGLTILVTGCGTPKGQSTESQRQQKSVIQQEPVVAPDRDMK